MGYPLRGSVARHWLLFLSSETRQEKTLAEENGWEIGPFHLPAPAGASDVLADSIRNTPAPDVDAMRQLIPLAHHRYGPEPFHLAKSDEPLERCAIGMYAPAVLSDGEMAKICEAKASA